MKQTEGKVSSWTANRYAPNGNVDWLKVGADTLPLLRAGSGPYFANYIKRTSKEERDVNHAATFFGLVLTDMADGFLSRRSQSGPDWLGGKLDQYADKVMILPIIRQLAKEGEIDPMHWKIAFIRDVGVSAGREVASFYGINGYARDLGKYKLWTQAAACTSALMPEDICSGDFTEQLFTIASAMTLASGIDQVQALTRETFDLLNSNESLAKIIDLDRMPTGDGLD